MNQLATIIKFLMKERSISVSELARQTQISQPVLHRLATGTSYNPQIATLIPIAGFFSISIDQLIGNVPLPGMLNQHPTTQHWSRVPLLNLKEIISYLDNFPSYIPQEFTSTDIPIHNRSYALQLKDTTMLPRFPKGSLLIINPDYPAETDDFVIAQEASQKEASFKQLLIDGERRYLKSLNPDFPILKMTKEHRILGVMMQARINTFL